MSTDLSDITREALSLPDDERVRLAQLLWDSLTEAGRGPAVADTVDAVAEAGQRDGELTSGKVQPQSHDEAIRAAREAIR
jgi:hypothetical protein